MATEPLNKAESVAAADIPDASSSHLVNDDQIKERAYLIWVDAGRPDGRELDHWLRAKWELERPLSP